MKPFLAALAFILLTLAPSSANAQFGKVKAYVSHAGNDSAGKQLAFLIKDQIRSSGTFSEARQYADGGMQLRLVTLDPDDRGNQTIYSATITIYNSDGLDYYVTSFVGNCGTNRLRDCAAALYGDLGTQLEEIRQALSKSGS